MRSSRRGNLLLRNPLARGECAVRILFYSQVKQRCNRGKVNLEIVVNAGFDSIMERVIPSIFRFKIIDKDAVFFRVYNPVFPDACRAVFEQLGMVVSPPAAGGYDFKHPVRRAIAALIIQFLGIADNRDIRFYIVPVILVKEYGKWGKKRFARAAF